MLRSTLLLAIYSNAWKVTWWSGLKKPLLSLLGFIVNYYSCTLVSAANSGQSNCSICCTCCLDTMDGSLFYISAGAGVEDSLLSSLLVLLYTVWVVLTKWDRVSRLSLRPSSTYHPLFYFMGPLRCTYHPFVLHCAAFTLITLQQSVVIHFLSLQRSVILCFFSLVFTSANPSRFPPFQFQRAHQVGACCLSIVITVVIINQHHCSYFCHLPALKVDEQHYRRMDKAHGYRKEVNQGCIKKM